MIFAFDWGTVIEQTLQAGFGSEAAVYALAAIGLNIHFGYAGLLNFGQVGFMAVGGYGVGITVHYFEGSFWAGLFVGILFAVVLALILGLPTLRLRADYLAIVTIAAAEIIRILVRSVWASPVTRGAQGISGFADAFYDINPFDDPRARYGFGPVKFLANDAWITLIGWIVVALSVLFVWQLMRSPWGRVVRAVREDEDAARALGKNAYWYKLQALMIGGVFGGIAGIVQVVSKQTVQPDTFVPPITFFVWTALILGGVGRVLSPVVGAMLFWALLALTDNVLRQLVRDDAIPEALLEVAQIGQIRFMLAGLGLILLMIFRPQGIFGSRREMLLDDR
ncbi:MAG: branched-chain amino acid ABC transporter permease [Actinomycetota bacterium]|nr:branched-chain amino acid ABC transporter permease [Actinomycetota bacterium]